jgi:hypothetical protein
MKIIPNSSIHLQSLFRVAYISVRPPPLILQQIQLDEDPSKGIQMPAAVEEPLDSKCFDVSGTEIAKIGLLYAQCK